MSNESVTIYREGHWTTGEHKVFVDAYKAHGKDWIKVSSFVRTRSNVQCRTHAQNYNARWNMKQKIKLEANNKAKDRGQAYFG